MVKTITKIGNSHGIILDAALLDLARLKPGDQVDVSVHDGGTVILTPVRVEATPGEFKAAVQGVLQDYKDTLRKLA